MKNKDCLGLGLSFLIWLTTSGMSQTTVGGLIDQQVWTAANSPYLVTNDITVANLTIQPGVSVVSSNYQFLITGYLQAIGTKSNLIVFTGNGSASWQGLLFNGASNNCQLQYCVVQNAANSGIRLRGTSLILQNCTISGNHAGTGGGINTDGPLTLQSCQISGNSADSLGGGIESTGGEISLFNTTISGNSVGSYDAHLAFGGGIHTLGPLSGEGTTISGNGITAESAAYGAGIYGNSAITLTNCDISGNAGYARNGGAVGGGIYCGGILQVKSCRISGNNVIFIGCCNGPRFYGAAIFCTDSAYDIIQNSIISGNTAGSANGIYFGPAVWFENSSGTATILNSVFYGNNSGVFQNGSGTVENCIFYANSIGTTGFNINYSMVSGGYPGTGNVDDSVIPVNSLFTDTTYFFLASSSPAIDAGDPATIYNDITFPPSKGGVRNDLGAYGGGGVSQNLLYVPALRITTQPLGQSIDFGATLQLNVAVTGADGPISYQWLFNGMAISNATNATLMITNFALPNVGAYSVTASDLARSVTSSSALVNVATLSIRFYAGVTLNGTVGSNYLVQSTPMLGGGSVWTDLTNITLPASNYIYIDFRSPTNSTQFYRALPQ